ATTTSRSGWPAASRSSSAPAYPDAPITPTEYIARAYRLLHTHANGSDGYGPVRGEADLPAVEGIGPPRHRRGRDAVGPGGRRPAGAGLRGLSDGPRRRGPRRGHPAPPAAAGRSGTGRAGVGLAGLPRRPRAGRGRARPARRPPRRLPRHRVDPHRLRRQPVG